MIESFLMIKLFNFLSSAIVNYFGFTLILNGGFSYTSSRTKSAIIFDLVSILSTNLDLFLKLSEEVVSKLEFKEYDLAVLLLVFEIHFYAVVYEI